MAVQATGPEGEGATAKEQFIHPAWLMATTEVTVRRLWEPYMFEPESDPEQDAIGAEAVEEPRRISPNFII